MTLSEFKAWFEGFTEDMVDRPTAKQWKRVQERVAEIVSQPTQMVYTGVPPRYYYPLGYPPLGSLLGGSVGAASGLGAVGDAQSALRYSEAATQRAADENRKRDHPTNPQSGAFDHYTNMQALGRADAQELN